MLELFVHYTALPEGMELEDEKMNPKLAQGAVKAYVQRAGFPKDTLIELGGMKINAYA